MYGPRFYCLGAATKPLMRTYWLLASRLANHQTAQRRDKGWLGDTIHFTFRIFMSGYVKAIKKKNSCKFFYLGNCYVTLYSQYRILFTATFRNNDYEDLWHGKWKEILVLSIMLCTQSTNNHNCHKNSDKKLSKIQCRDQDELNNLAPSSNVLISIFVCLGGDKSSYCQKSSDC